MESIWVTTLIAFGTGIAGSFSTWIFTRKSQNIANIDAAVVTWQKIVDSLEVRVNKLLEECSSLREENSSLIKEISSLREEIIQLKSQSKKILRYEKKISELNEKVITYEQLLIDNGIAF